jgi:hypothetical protein
LNLKEINLRFKIKAGVGIAQSVLEDGKSSVGSWQLAIGK